MPTLHRSHLAWLAPYQQNQGASLQWITCPRLKKTCWIFREWARCIEQCHPTYAGRGRRQKEGDGLVMSIHEKEEILIGDWLSTLRLLLQFSGEENSQTAS